MQVSLSAHPSLVCLELANLVYNVECALFSFGEEMQLLHPFQQQFNDESGARILRLCQFQQKKTRIAQVIPQA